MNTADEEQVKGWVLYDGACGMCSRWVPLWEATLKRRGFEIAPLQADWVCALLKLSPGQPAPDFRLLLAGGEQLVGAAAYRYLLRRIWWTTPLYLLSILPILRTLFDCAYRLLADNRYWISRRCHLPAADAMQSIRKD